ncbi:MAG: hypothetical protein ABSG93_10385, partial [Solirubrobacteraceae bacterium]
MRFQRALVREGNGDHKHSTRARVGHERSRVHDARLRATSAVDRVLIATNPIATTIIIRVVVERT